MRNLFYAFCHKNEKNSTCRYCWSCKIVWIHIQVLYKVWSLEINLGYMVTILKRKCRVLTGKHRTHHEYRKCISQKQMWIMLFIFFDIQGIVQVEFMPRGTNVNTEYYKGLLECLQNNMQWKGQKSGRTDLCFIMTMLCVTRLLSSTSFWLIKITVSPHHGWQRGQN